MKIIGIEGMTDGEISLEIQKGGRFVVFQYCASVIVISFLRSSNIYFVRAGGSALSKGWPYILITLILGWWGIPWGPLWSVKSIVINLRGGKDVTKDVVNK